jgi:hypothetical protein
MRLFRQICFATVLTFAFTMPALADGGSTQGPSITGNTQGPSIAGEIGTPGAPAPGDGHSPGAPSPGDQHNPGAAIMGDTQCPLTDNVDWSAVFFGVRNLLF